MLLWDILCVSVDTSTRTLYCPTVCLCLNNSLTHSTQTHGILSTADDLKPHERSPAESPVNCTPQPPPALPPGGREKDALGLPPLNRDASCGDQPPLLLRHARCLRRGARGRSRPHRRGERCAVVPTPIRYLLPTRYLLPAHWSELREHAVLTLPPCISPNPTLALIKAHTYTHSPSQSERRARSWGSSGVVVSSLSRSVSPRWSTSRASSCRRRPPAG